MEADIAFFLAQKAAGEATAGAGTDGGEVPPAEGGGEEPPVEKKPPIDQVRDNIDRRDADGANMAPEDVIAEQKADLEILLAEIDKLQASSDMNGDDGNVSPADLSQETSAEPGNIDGEGCAEDGKDKGVNMDSVDQRFKDRLDICRMADKLNLDENGSSKL